MNLNEQDQDLLELVRQVSKLANLTAVMVERSLTHVTPQTSQGAGTMSAVKPQSSPAASKASDQGLTVAKESGLQDDVDLLKLEIADLQSHDQQLGASLKAREQQILTLEEQLAEAQSASQRITLEANVSLSNLNAQLQLLHQFIWPHWLMVGGELQNWGARLIEQSASPNALGSARLLLATLHLYTAALAEPEGGDPRVLLDALRDLGRRLVSWLHDTETVTTDVADFAELWADHINRDCSSRQVSVRVPQPETAAESSWMNYNPKVGSPDIGSIQSWAVYGEKKLIAKAEVKLK